MPPYMLLRFGMVERHCNHIGKKIRLSVVGAFSFSFSLGSPLLFLPHFLPFFSSVLGSVFQSLLALLGYVIVEV